ncbi:indole-3-glycerol phosphate synthase TrpC [Neobacillus sp. PS3-34]|uniref:indole-3-glycerol phosphate synthase TrpC n=1 Tax=Neobacillus sp. PS3-34 TaxID=3070678 RepID=UPI0027DEEC18|nr:indole-3-glycerol phosphate synthase TrpC [Neobacillus sp. PS3-34]WML47903.1 indole-3-glycerol phosphate synthase TrpC [Neobacillus sp. PS3-34]
METILDRILKEKKQEIAKLKGIENQGTTFPKRSLIEKLKTADELAVIAEFKRASPSKGLINSEANPVGQGRIYESCGASAISVLTDQNFFKGSFEDLKAIREEIKIPILCKDFIIDKVQIDFASSYGADLVLLIAAALNEAELKELYQHATLLGLEVLVEVHNEKELEKALKIGSRLIGINNRDLRDFQVSLETTQKLAGQAKSAGAFLISESGIFSSNDAEIVRDAGANGILVGEALMRSGNLEKIIQELRLPLVKAV